jgi:hypothetical protein
VRCLANSLVVPDPDHLFIGVPSACVYDRSLVSKNIEPPYSGDKICMNNDTNSSAGGVGNDEYAFTVHKTSQTVTTECRGEGEKKTYVRFLEIAEGDVTVTINLDSLAQIVASKTLCSTSGKCRLLNGCITAVAANVTRTRQDL